MVTRAIASAQSQVEQQNFETRKNVLKYDEVLNRQREVIYGERRRVLEGEDLHEQIQHFMDDTIDAYVAAETAEGFSEEWDLDRLWGAFKQLYPVRVTVDELEEATGDRAGLTAEFVAESIKDDIHEQYEQREAQLGSEIMRELERRVVLSVLDRKWREHLYEMDYLQEGIGLRAMAQKDPLVEYQREGFDMFTAMMEGIKEESVGYLLTWRSRSSSRSRRSPSRTPSRPWRRKRRSRRRPPARRSVPRASTPRSAASACTSRRRPWTARAASSRATSSATTSRCARRRTASRARSAASRRRADGAAGSDAAAGDTAVVRGRAPEGARPLVSLPSVAVRP